MSKIKSEIELLYKKASKLLENGEITLLNELKESFLNFDKLEDKEQLELINKLSKSEKLPEIIHNFIELYQFQQTDFLNEVFEGYIYKEVGTYEDVSTLNNLVLASKKMHTLFEPVRKDRMFFKFLQQVAYGEQDKAEKLCSILKNDKKLQELLCHQGTVTDYSGRTFKNISAYEYAYWAKDTHMCRMLEQGMSEDTKTTMLKRCEAIETDGLTYTQHGEKIKNSKHFDSSPLTTAMQDYVDGYENWDNTNNLTVMKEAWMKVAMAQRDVPVHVINEYCRRDRSFSPTPEFNEDKLPRVMAFYNPNMDKYEDLFPLALTGGSVLGVDFGLVRFLGEDGRDGWPVAGTGVRFDLLAIKKLDKVRTDDLQKSLDNLKPTELRPNP